MKDSSHIYLQVWVDAIDEGFLKIGPENVQLVLAIARYIGTGTVLAWPSQKRLAQMCGISPSSISHRLAKLRKVRINGEPIITVVVQKKTVRGHFKNSVYSINDKFVSKFKVKNDDVTEDAEQNDGS